MIFVLEVRVEDEHCCEQVVAVFVIEAEAEACASELRKGGKQASVWPVTFEGCGCGGA